MDQRSVKKDRERRRRNVRLWFYIFSGFFFLIGILTFKFSLSSPTFQLKKILVFGTKERSPDYVVHQAENAIFGNRLAQIFGAHNIISWPASVTLIDPLIKNINIDRRYFKREVALNVTERERFGIWCSTECYWFDRDGVVLEDAPDTEGSLILRIGDGSGVPLIVGGNVIDPDQFAIIRAIWEGLTTLKLPISGFTFERETQEFFGITTQNTKLIFSTRFEPSEKIFAFLKTLLEDHLLSGMRYVDFTVKNRIYTRGK